MNTVLRTLFGRSASGEPIERITLDNGTLSCSVITYGAILQTLNVPDRNGVPVDIVLGFDTLADYLADKEYIGATVGRFANRIAAGHFRLDGKEYTLATNNGPNHLHGGRRGFSHRIWTISDFSSTHITLSLFSPNGEEGFPGNLAVKVTYRLDGNALVVQYWAETDQATPCSLTNHSYFNLGGHNSGTVLDQTLVLHASRYTPARGGIPIGTVEDVEDTPFDLRSDSCNLGAHIQDLLNRTGRGRGYDHNFVPDGIPGTVRAAAFAHSPRTGISMRLDTDQPGMQFYTANSLSCKNGKNGTAYEMHHAFCLETQAFPDAPNQPGFPSSILTPQQVYRHTARLTFSVDTF